MPAAIHCRIDHQNKDYKEAIARRTTASPLEGLSPVDIDTEKASLEGQIDRIATKEELVMYLNHPGDALKTIHFRNEFGNPNRIPLDVWFEGLVPGREIQFRDTHEKPHSMKILGIEHPDEKGMSTVRYTLNGEAFIHTVKVAEAADHESDGIQLADPANPNHVGAPSNGDLWIMYVQPGDLVKAGEELFNIPEACTCRVSGRPGHDSRHYPQAWPQSHRIFQNPSSPPMLHGSKDFLSCRFSINISLFLSTFPISGV